MNATVYPIPSRVEDELLRKQHARTEWMIEAAAYVKRCRTVDRLSGIEWAIACGTVATREPSQSALSRPFGRVSTIAARCAGCDGPISYGAAHTCRACYLTACKLKWGPNRSSYTVWMHSIRNLDVERFLESERTGA